MPLANEMETKNIRVEGGNPLEITIDDSEKGKYKITLPLSYDFRIIPVDSNGGGLPVSSIVVYDTKTIINTPKFPPQWKLKVIKLADLSGTDPTGTPATPTGDESGDKIRTPPAKFMETTAKYVDWLSTHNDNLEGEAGAFAQVVGKAAREIIIQKERA